MRFLNIVGNSLGCSTSGKRLVSAARDGDLQEAKALLYYNPRLVKYSTFGVRNSPLHYSAAQGHHEIVSLLLETGVDINLRNYRGQELHFEAVQLLLEFGASVTEKTVEDGTTIDLIGAGSTALHYAACGGNVQCCKMLIERGAKVTDENSNGRTPLMVARLWHRDSVVEMLSTSQNSQLPSTPSYLCLPMMSIIKIARDCGWRNSYFLPTCQDPCVVCLEGKCTVASEGCNHEFCTRCALYLCTMNCSSMVAKGPPGSIACPLCRHGIVSFIKLPGPRPVAKEIARTSLSLSFCGCSSERLERASLTAPLCNPPPLGSSFGSLSCRGFPSMKFSSALCRRASETNPCIISVSVNQGLKNELNKCSRIRLRRSSSSHVEGSRKSWFCSLNQYVPTSG